MGAVPEVEVAIVGLGLAGSAAAWALGRRGHAVTGFDSYSPGHKHGSSHGHSRIFRRAYLDPFYIELTGKAAHLWRELSTESCQPLLTRTGGLDHGPHGHPERLVATLRDHGVAADLLDPEEATRRRPGVIFEGPVVHHLEAGVIDPHAAMSELARLATARGARLLYEDHVRRLEPNEAGVRIITAQANYQARTVVVAAGPWTAPLLKDLIDLPPLSVTQQQVFFFRPYVPGTPWPTIIHEDEHSIYAMPEGDLIKIGQHTGAGKPTTADDRDFIVDPTARDTMIRYVSRNLPGIDPLPVRELTCLYTSTANEDFIIDRHGPLVICSPCSGHGAKFAPLIGEMVADLVEGGTPTDRFTLSAHR